MFIEPMENAEKLLNIGMYSQVMNEYGKILEKLFKQLYRRYLPSLPFRSKEKAISYEVKLGKSSDDLTIGQWLGLFRIAQFFDFISQNVGRKKFIFFTPAIIDLLNTLRNKATHPKKNDQYYISKETALFVKAAITCILHELLE